VLLHLEGGGRTFTNRKKGYVLYHPQKQPIVQKKEKGGRHRRSNRWKSSVLLPSAGKERGLENKRECGRGKKKKKLVREKGEEEKPTDPQWDPVRAESVVVLTESRHEGG